MDKSNRELIKSITRIAVKKIMQSKILIPAGVSNRHIHLSRKDIDILFGKGYELTKMKAVKQPGQYAAKEYVTLRGPKGEFKKVRILGPLRNKTQIEILAADCFKLGVNAPVRDSGMLDGTPGLEIEGPKGIIKAEKGTIVAARHVHMTPEIADLLDFKDGDIVAAKINGLRGGILDNILVRVSDRSAYEMHIDLEEANALGIKNDDLIEIIKK